MEPVNTTSRTPANTAKRLSWALVIATYDRAAVLKDTIRCGLRQSSAPLEVIVIDASDDWEQSRSAIERVLAEEQSDARLHYRQPRRRGITIQRNEGIEHATADILFLIDDDSLMHPDCARRVLDVFEHPDAERVIGACTALSPKRPDLSSAPQNADTANATANTTQGKINKNRQTGLKGRITKWFIGDYLPHYHAPPPAWDIPQSLRDAFGCFPRRHVHGARMVFRRSALDEVRFDEALDRYSYLEDIDLGYRLGRNGMIVMVPQAKLCHLGDLGGRLPSFKAAMLSVTNAAYLTRKNADQVGKNLWRLRVDAFKRSVFVLFKDLLAGRWQIPQSRGAWAGLLHSRWIGSTPIEQLDERYQQFQQRLLKKV